MKTLTITASDIKDGKYIHGSIDFDGHVEIDGLLGLIHFDSIRATGSLIISSGTSIEAGWYICAGWSIEADTSIEAGGSITAGTSIEAGGSITAGTSIEAGGSITAGTSIEAGWYICAGWSITAGTSITCKADLSAKLHIFAGLVAGRLPTDEDMLITCSRLECGTVAHGTLVQTGLTP